MPLIKFILSIPLGFLLLFSSSCSSWNWQQLKLNKPKHDSSFWHEVFAYNLDPDYRTGKLPIGWQAGVFHFNSFYFTTAKGELFELDLNNYHLKVLQNNATAIMAPPVINKDTLYYVTLDGDLVAYDLLARKESYHVSLGGVVDAPFVVQDGRIAIFLRSHTLLLLDQSTGKTLWSYHRTVTNMTSIERRSLPVINGQIVVAGFADGSLLALRLEDGSIVWDKKITENESRQFQDILMTPFVDDGKVWISSFLGPLKIYDLTTGSLLRTLNYHPSSSIMLNNATAYFGTQEGEIVAIDLAQKNELLRKKVTSGAVYQVHLWKNHLIFHDHSGSVQSYDLGTQKLEQPFFLGHVFSTIFGAISSNADHLALISSRNRLYLMK